MLRETKPTLSGCKWIILKQNFLEIFWIFISSYRKMPCFFMHKVTWQRCSDMASLWISIVISRNRAKLGYNSLLQYWKCRAQLPQFRLNASAPCAEMPTATTEIQVFCFSFFYQFYKTCLQTHPVSALFIQKAFKQRHLEFLLIVSRLLSVSAINFPTFIPHLLKTSQRH